MYYILNNLFFVHAPVNRRDTSLLNSRAVGRFFFHGKRATSHGRYVAKEQGRARVGAWGSLGWAWLSPELLHVVVVLLQLTMSDFPCRQAAGNALGEGVRVHDSWWGARRDGCLGRGMVLQLAVFLLDAYIF